ncbi:MAG TPA: hypothetical protein PLM53_08155 [Spirochaetota bacterium]|nr:hypothetical protein [Spirochaetota bacterium]HPL15051.1 hypothetical protein [Spirochaetota bacterium]HQF08058.1 hypothetical protein [Spirochaetota bacterium]HQH97055.1 hypothetical protein [Spirochaetota bacterium]HRS76952.1 hypothetical protein [Spirochaetota bacterium]
MRIETTINLDIGVVNDIVRASMITGISRRDIVSSLIKRLSRDHQGMVRSWIRVRYQARTGGNAWKRLHLALWPDEYEFFLDMRKVCKMSVSFLVSYAVLKYLDEVIRLLLKNSDNNRYKNYLIFNRIVDGIVCWTYCWGMPRAFPGNT